MDVTIEKFINWAKNECWEIKIHDEGRRDLPSCIVQRFRNIPKDFEKFLVSFDTLIAPDEKAWFISIDDYNNNSDLAFSWNEFENISLEASEGDHIWRKEIIKFWDRYMPVVLSVRNGYSYYAIDTESPDGAVVCGYEPEFEEIEKVADTYKVFLELVMNNEIEL